MGWAAPLASARSSPCGPRSTARRRCQRCHQWWRTDSMAARPFLASGRSGGMTGSSIPGSSS
eukprot:5406266-Alexandrium_andersonii.AAC.1